MKSGRCTTGSWHRQSLKSLKAFSLSSPLDFDWTGFTSHVSQYSMGYGRNGLDMGPPKSPLGVRQWGSCNCLHSPYLRTNTTTSNHISKVMNRRLGNVTLFSIYHQACIPDALKHIFEMLHVLFPGSTENNNVINVGCCIAFCSYDISSTNLWKMAGAPCKPKGILLNPNRPLGTLNVVKSFDDSVKGTCQYPLQRSRVVKKLAFPNRSISSSTLGSGRDQKQKLHSYMAEDLFVLNQVVHISLNIISACGQLISSQLGTQPAAFQPLWFLN